MVSIDIWQRAYLGTEEGRAEAEGRPISWPRPTEEDTETHFEPTISPRTPQYRKAEPTLSRREVYALTGAAIIIAAGEFLAAYYFA
jgi:hypothetical protein